MLRANFVDAAPFQHIVGVSEADELPSPAICEICRFEDFSARIGMRRVGSARKIRCSHIEGTAVLTLYDYLPSQNGWKVRVLLGLLKISYHSRIVSIFEGESRSESFLNLNPAGAIPV